MNSKTEKALSGIEWAIAQSVEKPKQLDEFTAEEFALQAGLTIDSARHRLESMKRKGLLEKRSVVVGKARTNVYRKSD